MARARWRRRALRKPNYSTTASRPTLSARIRLPCTRLGGLYKCGLTRGPDARESARLGAVPGSCAKERGLGARACPLPLPARCVTAVARAAAAIARLARPAQRAWHHRARLVTVPQRTGPASCERTRAAPLWPARNACRGCASRHHMLGGHHDPKRRVPIDDVSHTTVALILLCHMRARLPLFVSTGRDKELYVFVLSSVRQSHQLIIWSESALYSTTDDRRRRTCDPERRGRGRGGAKVGAGAVQGVC